MVDKEHGPVRFNGYCRRNDLHDKTKYLELNVTHRETV